MSASVTGVPSPVEVAARQLLDETAGTRASDERRDMVDAALHYVDERVRWLMAEPTERKQRDAGRTAAHNVFIDSLNILSRRMLTEGESNEWRRALGQDRGYIGDVACHLVCLMGLRAR